MISCYFETWKGLGNLASLTKYDVINLAFVDPQCKYTSGSFANTGLQFSESFSEVKAAITKLDSQNVLVMLSVGGASYPFTSPNITDICNLAKDLNCAGIDLDWEPSTGAASDMNLSPLIQNFHNGTGPWGRLSLTCWSTGAFPKDGSTYAGMNIAGLKSNGPQLAWINIMAYDMGAPADYSSILNAYRAIYSGPINVGFEVGPPGWGGYLLTNTDVINGCNAIKALSGTNNGVFIWAVNGDATGTPNPDFIWWTYKNQHQSTVNCPVCSHKLKIESA